MMFLNWSAVAALCGATVGAILSTQDNARTGLLIGAMEGREDARVVTLSSFGHWGGRIDFNDPQSRRRYNRWRAYSQSKLANLLFTFELERRLRAAGSSIRALAAHPGYAATNLQSAAPPAADRAVMSLTNRLVAQSAEMGALPPLYAATYPGVAGGTFIGPDGFGGLRGHPKPVRASGGARNPATAERLWRLSEELTDVRYEFAAAAAA